jgi:DNA-binding LytR/AlgR family response regulator
MLHIGSMVGLRKAVYVAMGDFYDFSHGALGRELFYEWRKDVLTYSLLAATYYFYRRYEEQRAARNAPLADDRIEVRDGGAAVFLAPGDISHVEAAGNYVEFHTATRTHLVRGTLASWEARLTARGFVRVHRSRLVNRTKIAALKPTPSGDVEITLNEGRTVLGSRRYRAVLTSAPST